jgi:hypothetical protein
MKKVICLLLAVFLLCVSCGHNLVCANKEYKTVGLFTQYSVPREVTYEPIWGNVFWGLFLFPTWVAPIYFFGFSLYEPVSCTPQYPVCEIPRTNVPTGLKVVPQ